MKAAILCNGIIQLTQHNTSRIKSPYEGKATE